MLCGLRILRAQLQSPAEKAGGPLKLLVCRRDDAGLVEAFGPEHRAEGIDHLSEMQRVLL